MKIDPSLAEAYNLRGIVLEKLGRKAEALESYKQAIDLDPNFPQAKDNLIALEDKMALLPRWFRNGVFGIAIFLAVTYGLELYLLSKGQFHVLDRILFVVLNALYTPGIIVQIFLENSGPEPWTYGWMIRIASSLPFGYIGGVTALRRQKILLISSISLLFLYLLFFVAWYVLFWLARSFVIVG